MASRVTFNQDRCKGCSLCTVVCPKNIIFLDRTITNRRGYHPATVEDMAACIGCANCARMCPDSVITVERNIEEEKTT
ncbi:MAG TPA: 4Fe-4S dicluster domain-containing protein [Fastidiosipila sp.]|nr:4Fe-4S dicluster domain-containing protein [Fastidiosipila sp.]